MGQASSVEDDGNISPKSPRSPRVQPIDQASGGETPVPALLDKEASLNYTINRVEAIVDNRTRTLEADLAATREKVESMETKIDQLAALAKAIHARRTRLGAP